MNNVDPAVVGVSIGLHALLVVTAGVAQIFFVRRIRSQCGYAALETTQEPVGLGERFSARLGAF